MACTSQCEVSTINVISLDN